MNKKISKPLVKTIGVTYLRLAQVSTLLGLPLYVINQLNPNIALPKVLEYPLYTLDLITAPIQEILRSAIIPSQSFDVAPILPEIIFALIVCLGSIGLVYILEKLVNLLKAWSAEKLYTVKSVLQMTQISRTLAALFVLNLGTIFAQEVISAIHNVQWYGDSIASAFNIFYVIQTMPSFLLVFWVFTLAIKKIFTLQIELKEDSDLNI